MLRQERALHYAKATSTSPSSRTAIIIGAGPAGLSCAKLLQDKGIAVVILEKATNVGSAWRSHYDRLHLHTDRRHSALPGLPMPPHWPKYPSRKQVIGYLERYAAQHHILPRFGYEVSSVSPTIGDQWKVDCGIKDFCAPIVIIATGIAATPCLPSFPGLDSFAGTIIHSSQYKNALAFSGQRVLVVGFGNSGGEIALDLAESGVKTTLAVRGPLQIIPRDLLGLPIITWALLYRHLPARIVDCLNAPILRVALGDIERLGLTRAVKGPRQAVEEDGRVPVIDIGTLARIRDGTIAVRPGISIIGPQTVTFQGGRRETFDSIVLATGYSANVQTFLDPAIAAITLNNRGAPIRTGRATSVGGLFFCGQSASATGQLRAIGIEAKTISDVVSNILLR